MTFDRRGHGRSDDPCRGYDFDTLADDIAAVMDALDLQNIVLVGHSMGGAEVVRYLTRYRSHRVTHAVLIAPTTPFTMKTDDNPGGAPREALEKTRESLKHDLPHLVAEAAPDFFGVPKNSVSIETMDWWSRQFLDRCSIKVLSELYKVMTETDFRTELRTIRTPTLILHGDIDKSAAAGIDRSPDSRTHRRQPVVGIRECRSRSAVHAHGSYAGGYRRVCGRLEVPVIGGVWVSSTAERISVTAQ